MEKLAIVRLFVSCLTHAQGYRDLLLPSARTITGQVVDQAGKPISQVTVEHDYQEHVSTDSDGKFRLETRAPAVVFRKAEYRSYFLRTATARRVRIVLEEAKFGQARRCAAAASCQSIARGNAKFCFPMTAGVKAYPQVRDIDYEMRSYAVKTAKGPTGIRHGSGPNWSDGVPPDLDVWQSVEYTEATYSLGKDLIVDARGRTGKGKWWRYLGKFDESASYNDADEGVARLFDRMLDGMCIGR